MPRCVFRYSNFRGYITTCLWLKAISFIYVCRMFVSHIFLPFLRTSSSSKSKFSDRWFLILQRDDEKLLISFLTLFLSGRPHALSLARPLLIEIRFIFLFFSGRLCWPPLWCDVTQHGPAITTAILLIVITIPEVPLFPEKETPRPLHRRAARLLGSDNAIFPLPLNDQHRVPGENASAMGRGRKEMFLNRLNS